MHKVKLSHLHTISILTKSPIPRIRNTCFSYLKLKSPEPLPRFSDNNIKTIPGNGAKNLVAREMTRRYSYSQVYEV